jgi:hypothetical protein
MNVAIRVDPGQARTRLAIRQLPLAPEIEGERVNAPSICMANRWFASIEAWYPDGLAIGCPNDGDVADFAFPPVTLYRVQTAM